MRGEGGKVGAVSEKGAADADMRVMLAGNIRLGSKEQPCATNAPVEIMQLQPARQCE